MLKIADILALSDVRMIREDKCQEHLLLIYIMKYGARYSFKVDRIDGTRNSAFFPSTPSIAQRYNQLGAEGLIVMHNHPTDSTKPSIRDIISWTTLLVKFPIEGVNYIDDIIVNSEEYFSFREMFMGHSV